VWRAPRTWFGGYVVPALAVMIKAVTDSFDFQSQVSFITIEIGYSSVFGSNIAL
jgi:hypothetical protein